MADHARQFPLETGKGLFVKQVRDASGFWALLPRIGFWRWRGAEIVVVVDAAWSVV